MYEFIPKEILAAVEKKRIEAIQQACDDLDDKAARHFSVGLAAAGMLAFLGAGLCSVRPDLLPAMLQSMERLTWALTGLGLGLFVAAGACLYAWRQRERLLLAQVSSLISRMERQCALKILLRWWSKARSVSDIPAPFKDLAVRLIETRDRSEERRVREQCRSRGWADL